VQRKTHNVLSLRSLRSFVANNPPSVKSGLEAELRPAVQFLWFQFAALMILPFHSALSEFFAVIILLKLPDPSALHCTGGKAQTAVAGLASWRLCDKWPFLFVESVPKK
jgi:hypothetical protein